MSILVLTNSIIVVGYPSCWLYPSDAPMSVGWLSVNAEYADGPVNCFLGIAGESMAFSVAHAMAHVPSLMSQAADIVVLLFVVFVTPYMPIVTMMVSYPFSTIMIEPLTPIEPMNSNFKRVFLPKIIYWYCTNHSSFYSTTDYWESYKIIISQPRWSIMLSPIHQQ